MLNLRRPPFFIAALLALTSACASAPTTDSTFSNAKVAPQNPWEKDPVFIEKDSIDTVTVLGAPPEKGSAVDRKDIAVLLQAQKKRTTGQCDQAAKEEYPRLAEFFGPPRGPLTATETARWTEFVETVGYDTDYFVRETKKHWSRPRPYDADPRVEPCIKKHASQSYPSGHSTLAWIYAYVLSDLSPARKAVFHKRAQKIADNRVLGGVHHPSDLAAGKKLADRVIQELRRSAKFKAALAEAKAKK